jgi:hypothetical protein
MEPNSSKDIAIHEGVEMKNTVCERYIGEKEKKKPERSLLEVFCVRLQDTLSTELV